MSPAKFLTIRKETLRLTQAQLADLLKLSRSYVTELESGRRPISPQVDMLMQALATGWRPRP